MYKVLITTSGTGNRLGELTKQKNKALIEIEGKTILERIIDIYPPQHDIVITLGYLGDDIEQFVKQTYPHRPISFVTVDTFEGKGSSLGYSMLCAKKLLHTPFIFHTNDTLVHDVPSSPEECNWIAGSKGNDSSIFTPANYSSLIVDNGYVTAINSKGASYYDYLHIGLIGIHDHTSFWDNLEQSYKKTPEDTSLNDVSAITLMLTKGIRFKFFETPEWLDTGNTKGLENARKRLHSV